MSEVQNEPVEPFRLHDPTKEGPVPTVNDKPLAAADVRNPREEEEETVVAVSYTHLTLPTILLV